ncbi:MAG TPA: ATP-binding cassette domain-containing protein [Acholeplasmataceae bacterium]|nr:ATP-binding cassette domain-containing protein [Acholeplasmataceae bacterium]
MSTPLIEVNNLTKTFNKKSVIKNLSLKIYNGIYLLKGSNGSGKTTFMKLVMGLLRPTKGSIIKHFKTFNYLPELLIIKSNVLVKDYLTRSLRLRNLKRNFKLESYFKVEVNKPLKTLSKGNLKKVLLYLTLIDRKEMLFLDEPFDGLDKVTKEKAVKYLDENKCNCLISSHQRTFFKNFKKVIYFD